MRCSVHITESLRVIATRKTQLDGGECLVKNKSQEKITRDCVSRIGRKLGRSRHLIWNHIPRHANASPTRQNSPQSPKCLSNPYPDAPTLSRAQNQRDAHSRTSCRDRRPEHSHRRRHSPRPHDRANTTADRTRATSLRTA